MKLLIVTQKVDQNDPIFGFFHRWLEEFATHCESVIVICLQKGEFHLSANVQILSLGKESKRSRIYYLIRFYQYIFRFQNDYEAVFVHMNPEYVVLGGWLWRFWHKRIYLWYVHRQVNVKLRWASQLVEAIFTVTRASFQLPGAQIIPVGHGVDTAYFVPKPFQHDHVEKFQILSVGRITRIKKLEDLFYAVSRLPEEIKKQIQVQLVGGPITADDLVYKKELEGGIEAAGLRGKVEWVGDVPFGKIKKRYYRANLCVNLAPTGGIDKTVLESLSCGVPTFFRNQAFCSLLGAYGDIFYFQDVEDLSQKIKQMIQGETVVDSLSLHRVIAENHDVRNLIKKLVEWIKRNSGN